eukprot:gi/632963046/ref/XP_007897664.1/ PREDICTED: uncharacterized protein LOC103182450 isoform X1 [Callorhinchus milii]
MKNSGIICLKLLLQARYCLVLLILLPVAASETEQERRCKDIQMSCEEVTNDMETQINKLAGNLLPSMLEYEKLVDMDRSALNGVCFVSFTLTQLLKSMSLLNSSFAPNSENSNLTSILMNRLNRILDCQKEETCLTDPETTIVRQCVGYFFEYFQSILNRYRRIFQNLCVEGARGENPDQPSATARFMNLKGDCITVLHTSGPPEAGQSEVLSATAGSPRAGGGSSNRGDNGGGDDCRPTETTLITSGVEPRKIPSISVTQTHTGAEVADSHRSKPATFWPCLVGGLAVALLIFIVLFFYNYQQKRRLERQYIANLSEGDTSTIPVLEDTL